MQQLRLRIRGLRPILSHNPASMGQSNDGGIKTKKIPTPQEEAEAGCYRDPDGALRFPSIGIRNAIIRAASGRKIGKVSAAMVVSGSLFMLDEWIPFVDSSDKPITTYAIDTRRAVVQRAGVLRSRPRLDQWESAFAVEYDENFLNPKVIVELLTLAGRLVGIGDYRPQCKGPYGLFEVIEGV